MNLTKIQCIESELQAVPLTQRLMGELWRKWQHPNHPQVQLSTGTRVRIWPVFQSFQVIPIPLPIFLSQSFPVSLHCLIQIKAKRNIPAHPLIVWTQRIRGPPKAPAVASANSAIAVARSEGSMVSLQGLTLCNTYNHIDQKRCLFSHIEFQAKYPKDVAGNLNLYLYSFMYLYGSIF